MQPSSERTMRHLYLRTTCKSRLQVGVECRLPDATELVTRLLHQLSFVATTSPLDSTTYSLASMLFGRVISQGVGAAQSEEAQEQITLVGIAFMRS